MKFPVPKTLVGAVLPMLLTNWIIGLGVIEYPIGKPRRIISTFWSIVNFAFFMGLTEMADFPGIVRSRESIIEGYIYRTNVCLYVASVAFFMCLARIKTKVVKDTFLALTSINDRLDKLGIPNDYQLLFETQIIQLGIVFTSQFILMVLHSKYIMPDLSNESSFIGVFLGGYYFLTFSFSVNYTLSGSIRYFGNRFRYLNALLIESSSLDRSETTVTQSDDQFFRYSSVIRELHGNTSQSIRAAKKQWLLHVIRETRIIHRRLCNAAMGLDRAFGMQVLISVALAFNMITSLLYKFYSIAMASSWNEFIDGLWLHELVIIICITYHGMRVLIIVDTCNATSCEANLTGRLIDKLLDTAAHNDDIRDEINIFSLQLLQIPLNFTAMGFFPLNYSLVHGIIGSVSTYLIIMIQFRDIDKPASTNVTPNSTMLMLTNGTD